RTPQVWLVPNAGSDVGDLFTRPDDWPHARRQIDVFGFYSGQLEGAPCAICGPNDLAALREAGAFARLTDGKIAIDVEASAIKPDDCDATANAALAAAALHNVIAAGGRPAYLSMDEPLLSGG